MIKSAFLTTTKLIKAPLYKKVLGLLFAFIVALILEIQAMVTGLWFLMFVNVYFGVKVSLKNNKSNDRLFIKIVKTIKSKKLEQTIGKGLSYLVILTSVYILREKVINLNHFTFISDKASVLQIVAGVFAFVELWGIGENFSILYGINPVKWIYEIFKRKEFVKPEKIKNDDEYNK